MKPLVFLSIVCYRIWDAQCGFFMRCRWDHHIVWYLVMEWKSQYPSVRVFVSVTWKATLAKFLWELVVHVNSRSGVVKARSVVALCCGSICSTMGNAQSHACRFRKWYTGRTFPSRRSVVSMAMPGRVFHLWWRLLHRLQIQVSILSVLWSLSK